MQGQFCVLVGRVWRRIGVRLGAGRGVRATRAPESAALTRITRAPESAARTRITRAPESAARTHAWQGLALAAGLALLGPVGAEAGVFNMSHFVEEGKFAIGVEPELTLTNGAGLGANLKYTHGMSDLLNVTAILGTGSGPRQFRTGMIATLDVFPNTESQPGIGISAQGTYYRLPTMGRFELMAVPYIHKAFLTKSSEFEPFFAVPVGMGILDGGGGGTQFLSTLAIGSLFKSGAHFRYVLEFGIAVSNTETYLSGGVVYYY